MSRFVQVLDPARSLTTAVGWLAATLSLAIAALTVWVSNFADHNMLSARDAVLSSSVKTLAVELDRALSSKLLALESLASTVPPPSSADATAHSALSKSLVDLRAAHPELAWTGFADTGGRLVAQTGRSAMSSRADETRWMQRCVQGAWFAELPQSHVLGLCSPIVDGQGRTVGLAAAQLPQGWLAAIAQRVRDRLDVDRRARALVVDDRQHVLVDTGGNAAPSLPGAASAPSEGGAANPFWTPGQVAVQRLDDDKRHVVVRARDDDNPTLRRLGLQVLLVQPAEEPFWRGGVNQRQIAWMSLGLSVLAALVGVVFARRLTRRLTDLTAAVKSVGTNPEARIEAPAGKDEVSELGHAFSALLDTLRHEHDALTTLTSELEQRVAARTREVELLAADSHYAAVVRERLRLARDLHDTLAHSMMAMLAEVRLLRKLHTHDPSAMAAELERAEQVAHDGLNEARDAIGQIRLNVVRDLGLGPALSSAISRFGDRTGLDVAYKSDPHAWTFADERAEVMFRIAEEALRNIDRHARASHVDVTLQDHDNATIELTIRDDGVGFDAESPHPGHYGLIGMREQAQLIGAELAVTSVAQQGSTLRLRLRVGPGLPS